MVNPSIFAEPDGELYPIRSAPYTGHGLGQTEKKVHLCDKANTFVAALFVMD